MIKQYDEMLHKNWDLSTEEQKVRIESIRAKVDTEKEEPISITFVKASERK